jgi:hypothetical protein
MKTQRLEKYSERFDNDKSAIGNPDTWGKRMVDEEETVEEAAEKYANMHQDVSEELGIYLVKAVFQDGIKYQQERSYSEEEVLHLLDSLWDRLDIWYNEKVDREFNLIDWFNKCELKKK